MATPAPTTATKREPSGLPATTPDPRRPARLRFGMRALGVTQGLKLGACFAGIATRSLFGEIFDPFGKRRGHRRERALAEIARTFGGLKGIFAKAGQFAGLRYDVLAPEVRDAFAELEDRVPPLSFAAIRRVVESELGRPLEELFSRFDPVPVGAASIAQVHRAQLGDGSEVAVKVQYPWLAVSLPADLLWARILGVGLVRRSAWAGVDRRRLFDEFAAGFREELDFEREARIAEQIAGNLVGDPGIVVPRVYASHSSSRVLTLAYHEGIRITDAEELARQGIEGREILEILGRGYAKQVFVDGLFHADPHPGNLFVLPPDGAHPRARLLFVDFGLSKRLDPNLRGALQRGIYALLQRDREAFVHEMDGMGMIAPDAHEGVRRAVCEMFERIEGEGAVLGLGGSQVLGLKDEAKRLLERTAGLQLPNDLLLYAKTLSYLFALGPRLAPDVDLMRICLPYLLRFLSERGAESASAQSEAARGEAARGEAARGGASSRGTALAGSSSVSVRSAAPGADVGVE